MKTSNKIIAFGLIMACMACGAKKSTQSNMEENQQEMAANGPEMGQDGMDGEQVSMESSEAENSAMGENGMNDGNMEEDSMNGESSIAYDSELANANNNIDYLDMYSQLDMSSYQIQQFETALTDFHTKRKITSSGEMLGSLSDERDRQLKDILSEEQYSAYESWKESN